MARRSPKDRMLVVEEIVEVTEDRPTKVVGNGLIDEVGVTGISETNDGVLGVSGDGRGVHGESTKGHGVVAESRDAFALVAMGEKGGAASLVGYVKIVGDTDIAGKLNTTLGLTASSEKDDAVLGVSGDGRGVHGESTKGHGVVAESRDAFALVAMGEKGGAALLRGAVKIEGDTSIAGNLTCQKITDLENQIGDLQTTTERICNYLASISSENSLTAIFPFNSGAQKNIMASYSSAGGPRLSDFLNNLPILTRWLAGHPVVWQTGQQNGPDEPNPNHHTHCSAFAAAAALYLDIYLLRPPHHSQNELANAQTQWLSGEEGFEGPSASLAGWTSLGLSGATRVLATCIEAANAGQLVLACYASSASTPGHVAIVRPQSDEVSIGGPYVIMAGERNFTTISMQRAFSDHPGAWPNNIALFVHNTVLQHDVTG